MRALFGARRECFLNWFYRLQRKMRWLAIDNLMIYVTVTMLAVFLMETLLRFDLTSWLVFRRDLVLQGQIWRLFSFVVIPPESSILFIILSLYFCYFIGNSLEQTWGAPQFTFYYLCGVVATIIAGLLAGGASNTYLNLSLFFAFAQLFPDYQILLFFVLPVKVKYLAYINWFFFILSFVGSLLIGQWAICASILASLLNFFLFFGKDLWGDFQNWRRFGGQRRRFRKENRKNNDFWRQ